MLERDWVFRHRHWLIASAVALVLALLLKPSPAWAHPLGNFTVNRYARIDVYPGRVSVRYVLDMAEIPTFQEKDKIDLNQDGQVSDGERARYAEQKAEELRRGLQLIVNGRRVELDLTKGSPDIALLAGQAGLPVLRLSAWLEATLSQRRQGERADAVFNDDNDGNRLGWKEIIVRSGDGVSLLQSSVSSEDQSHELLSYPQDLLKSPLDVQRARFTFEVGLTKGAAVPAIEGLPAQRASSLATQVSSAPVAKSDSRFASLIAKQRLTVPFVLLALLASVGWGALHAFTPGHGKTIVAAYLLGSRATPKHAVSLGLSVTVTHTLAVVALGLATLLASRYLLPEELFPWLQLASGVLVMALGIGLLQSRLRNARHSIRASRSTPVPAVAGAYTYEQAHRTSHAHSYPHDSHDHANVSHTHASPSSESAKPAWKSLLAIGISGGLLPCPAAILIMLSAISLDRVGFGLLLVIAFSAGLAGTLTSLGLLVLYGQRMLMRFRAIPGGALAGPRGLMLRASSLGSAAIISVVGIVMAVQAVLRM